MSTEKARREAKKREKTKKKRDDARRTRGSRAIAGVGGRMDVREALDWPVGEAWVGERWHERGARVDALLTRRHEDGRLAVAIFELDLAEHGVLAVQATAPVMNAQVQSELVRRSSEGHALAMVSPALLVKLVRTAERFGVARGHGLPDGYEAAAAMFGDLREQDAPEEILCGTEDGPAEAAAPAAEGFLATLKRRLGLGG